METTATKCDKERELNWTCPKATTTKQLEIDDLCQLSLQEDRE
jgi:hypothetical protein